MTDKTYTRSDYMENRCNHRQYYAQFVNNHVRALVAPLKKRIVASKDEHLNDIPLAEWDALAGRIMGRIEDGSLCAKVCTLKEAANQLRDEAVQS